MEKKHFGKITEISHCVYVIENSGGCSSILSAVVLALCEKYRDIRDDMVIDIFMKKFRSYMRASICRDVYRNHYGKIILQEYNRFCLNIINDNIPFSLEMLWILEEKFEIGIVIMSYHKVILQPVEGKHQYIIFLTENDIYCPVSTNRDSFIFEYNEVVVFLNNNYEIDENICSRGTITITFGEQVENHKGMQMIGKLAKNGLNKEDLDSCKSWFDRMGYITELVDLKLEANSLELTTASSAYLLIVRDGVNLLLSSCKRRETKSKLYEELINLPVDTKAFMYGRVVNKHARHNLCFADFDQEPKYSEGKGTVVNFNRVPFLSHIRKQLGGLLGEKGNNLLAEGNYYYDISKCGIGFHGDSERKVVVALRLGTSMPLHYQWHINNERVGDRIIRILNNGDVYIMSEKATGFDWKSRKIPTLRHAAGCEKFLK